MNDQRLADVLRVCREALAREDGERLAYLDAACGGDVSLRAEVEALLAEQRGEARRFSTRPRGSGPHPPLPQATGWADTRSSRRLEPAGWVRSTKRATRA